MRKHLSPIFPLAFCLAVCLGIAGLSRSAQAQSYLDAWRTFDQFDGAVGNWIYSTEQGTDATLWFGTDQGILRYNGVWRAFGEAEGIPAGAVRSLLLDTEGDLWAATAGGVARLQDDTWVIQGEEDGIVSAPFAALAQRDDGDILAAGKLGLFVRDSQTQKWERIGDSPVNDISALAVDAQDQIWLAGGSLLYRYQQNGWRPVLLQHDGLPIESDISVLEPSVDGSLWIAVDNLGIAHLTTAGVSWHSTGNGLSLAQVLALFEAAPGDLWVGTNGGGVGHWVNDTWEEFTISDGLAANFVTEIFRDRDGVFWFGTVAGISFHDSSSWRQWGAESDVPAGSISDGPTSRVKALVEDDEGRLWVGTFGEGVYLFDGNHWQTPQDIGFTEVPDTPYIESGFISADGSAWFGANRGGVVHFPQGDDKVEHLTPGEGLSGDTVVAISQTPDGVMWFGIYQRGIDRWDGKNWSHITIEDGLISDNVQALFVDSGGRLWVGTEQGLSVLENGGWRSITDQQGLAGLDVSAISEGHDGGLWFATWGDGVSKYLNDVWTTYTTSDGLLAPGVEAVWADPASPRVWFGTVSGLSEFDGRSWQNYGISNGLNIGRVQALHSRGEDGISLGTTEGLAQFWPDQTPPSVSIEAINGMAPVNAQAEVSPEDTIRIDWEGRDLLTAASDLFYLYRMTGYDADWQQTRRPQTTYPPLPEGSYTFEVQVRDTGLNYSAPVALALRVQRQPSTVWLPAIGNVRAEVALAGVAVLSGLAVLGIYAAWSTLARRAMAHQAVERRFNPYVAGSPIREDTMFYGRAQLLKEVESTLHKNSVMIHGERRIGKTSLLFQLLQRLQNKTDGEYRFIPVFIDLEGTPEPQFFHRLMEGALDAVHNQLPDLPQNEDLFFSHLNNGETYEDRYFRRDLRALIDDLKTHLNQQPRLVLLLDEADIMNTYDTITQQQLRRILQDAFAHNVGVVVAGVNISKSWDRVESPWYNMFIEMAMPPFDRQEAERLMREPVAQFYRWDKDAIHYVYAQSQGRPHRIQQICLEAVNCMLDQKRRRIMMADVQQAYERILFAESH